MTPLWQLGWTAGAFATATLIALALRRLILTGLPRWAPTSEVLSAGAKAFRGPSLWWCVVVGLYVANGVAEDFSLLPTRWHHQLGTALNIALVLSVTVTLAGLAGNLVARAVERNMAGVAVTGLAQTGSRIAVLVVGLLVLLSTLGIQIAPILATLGVGGLAVALALQDTLSNLFAGIHLLADSPLRVGDHVRLGDRVEGFVIDVGWRSTRIRSLSNDVVVVPNQVVAKEPITNYDLPEPRSAFRLKISVDDSADPDTVIKVLRDEIERAAGQVPGLSANPAPWVSLLSGVTEGSLDVTVSYYVPTPSDQYRVLHELRKRCSERLHREGIAVRGAARAA